MKPLGDDILRLGERTRELGERLARSTVSGPFLYCDYWASVFSLRRIMNPAVLRERLVSLDLFRQALDRPKTRLPRLRYYILAFVLGPGFLAYRLAFNLAMLLRPKSREKIIGHADVLLDEYRLEMRPTADPRWVRVRAGDREFEEPVLNPELVQVENGTFFPTYKLLVAATVTVVFSLLALPALQEAETLHRLGPATGLLFYPLLVLMLQLLVRDLLTSFIVPIPVLGVKALLTFTGHPWLVGVGMISAGVLFYFMEWFFIPRGVPPSLYLYVNDPEHPLFPYRERHAPYWLKGRVYWVWRFMSLMPAEIHKVWERDWERAELWIRADEGPEAGRLEWMVTDIHWREVWFSYDHVAGDRHRRRHDALRRERLLGQAAPLVWRVETDMHILAHTPEVVSIFLSPPRPPLLERAFMRILRTMFSRRPSDDSRQYRDEVERLEVTTGEFLRDISEHFRNVALGHILRLPWSYWRYPMGVRSSPRTYLYDGGEPPPEEGPAASDPRYQIKAFKEEVLREGQLPRRAPPRTSSASGAGR